MFSADYNHNSTGNQDREATSPSMVPSDMLAGGGDLNDSSSSIQPPSRGIFYRTVTCLLLIVLPIFVASTFITFFLMKTTSLGNQNYLHEYAIYAFIIFSIASVFPFGLFFLVVLMEKIHSKYRRRQDQEEARRVQSEESRSFSSNIFERQVEGVPGDIVSLTRRQAIFIGFDYGRRRRGTLQRQDAFDCPPGYDDLEMSPGTEMDISAAVVEDEQPPSYEVAIMCPMVQGNSSFDGETKPWRYKLYGGGGGSFCSTATLEEMPPTYDEKTMKS